MDTEDKAAITFLGLLLGSAILNDRAKQSSGKEKTLLTVGVLIGLGSAYLAGRILNKEQERRIQAQ
jgi:hypothetical protein